MYVPPSRQETTFLNHIKYKHEFDGVIEGQQILEMLVIYQFETVIIPSTFKKTRSLFLYILI
jgi:hypothetical protein